MCWFHLSTGGEGTADWIPEHRGQLGGSSQDCSAALPPRCREPPGKHNAHQSHLWLQADRGMRFFMLCIPWICFLCVPMWVNEYSYGKMQLYMVGAQRWPHHSIVSTFTFNHFLSALHSLSKPCFLAVSWNALFSPLYTDEMYANFRLSSQPRCPILLQSLIDIIKKAELCHFTVDTMRGKLCILCTLLFCAFSVWWVPFLWN